MRAKPQVRQHLVSQNTPEGSLEEDPELLPAGGGEASLDGFLGEALARVEERSCAGNRSQVGGVG